MLEESGWISVHRKLKDSPIYSDSQAVHLWVHLLLSVNHKDKTFLYNGRLTTVKRGQIITGRQALAIATGISESKVQRLLVAFEELKMIEQQTNSKNRYISITNYDLYQSSEQQANSRRTAGEQQANTNNNVNNENNDKEEEIQAGAFVDSKNLHDEIQSLYNSICTDLPKCQNLSDKRKKRLSAQFKKSVVVKGNKYRCDDLDFWEKYFYLVHSIDWLNGRGDKKFSVDFEYVIREENIIKFCEAAI